MEIKCRLKVILAERGLRYGYVAEKAGVNNSTFSLLVNGKSLPTLPVAYKIAEVLEMNVMEIWIVEK